MNISDTRALLKELAANAELAKRTVLKEVNDGLIIDEETKHEFDELFQNIERDVATATVFWAKLQRMGASSKKFAAIR